MSHSEDDLFDIQLEIALAESLTDTKSAKLSSAELAYFTDVCLNNIVDNNNGNPSSSMNTFESSTNNNRKASTVRTSYRPILPIIPSKITSNNIKESQNDALYPTHNNSKSTNNVPQIKIDKNTCSSSRTANSNLASFVATKNDHSYLSNFFPSMSSTSIICSKCMQSIVTGNYITASEKYSHKDCFRCDGCSIPIVSQYVNKRDSIGIYHAECAVELFNPKCSLCSNTLHSQFYKHPFFENEKYCMDVIHESRKDCFSCNQHVFRIILIFISFHRS